MKKWEEAEKDAGKAIEMDPKNAKVRQNNKKIDPKNAKVRQNYKKKGSKNAKIIVKVTVQCGLELIENFNVKIVSRTLGVLKLFNPARLTLLCSVKS